MAFMKTDPWLSCPRPNPQASLRLFCFPYSGAAANVYYSWADVLPTAIEVCPVQLPGRGTRVAEPSFLSLTELVEAVAEGLSPYLDKPFAFFGHSMGALIAFELARLLRERRRLSPLSLFVSAHEAPQVPDSEPPLHTLPEAEFIEKVRSLNGTPEEVLQNEELRALVLPILRADFTVCETYAYSPARPLDCPICVLSGLGDGYVRRENLEKWKEQTTAGFSLRFFPGDHFFLHTARPMLLQVIARELSPYLK